MMDLIRIYRKNKSIFLFVDDVCRQFYPEENMKDHYLTVFLEDVDNFHALGMEGFFALLWHRSLFHRERLNNELNFPTRNIQWPQEIMALRDEWLAEFRKMPLGFCKALPDLSVPILDKEEELIGDEYIVPELISEDELSGDEIFGDDNEKGDNFF